MLANRWPRNWGKSSDNSTSFRVNDCQSIGNIVANLMKFSSPELMIWSYEQKVKFFRIVYACFNKFHLFFTDSREQFAHHYILRGIRLFIGLFIAFSLLDKVFDEDVGPPWRDPVLRRLSTLSGLSLLFDDLMFFRQSFIRLVFILVIIFNFNSLLLHIWPILFNFFRWGKHMETI